MQENVHYQNLAHSHIHYKLLHGCISAMKEFMLSENCVVKEHSDNVAINVTCEVGDE